MSSHTKGPGRGRKRGGACNGEGYVRGRREEGRGGMRRGEEAVGRVRKTERERERGEAGVRSEKE